ncbi:MAG: hypothetical protein LCH63_16880 [Candidatus Melainabacteria bacterium]|jgi:CheY-like chemotaxis protein|nr:hypothetical protein [Candidatus Melainabacteria bacterium]
METPKILVAGTAEATTNLVREALEPLDYQIVTARAMSVALFLAQKNLPELIVSPLEMLDGDGFSFLYELKLDEELQGIPFVFCLSSQPETQTELQAMKEGATKVVVNSMAPLEFRSLVNPLILDRLTSKGKRPEHTPE